LFEVSNRTIGETGTPTRDGRSSYGPKKENKDQIITEWSKLDNGGTERAKHGGHSFILFSSPNICPAKNSTYKLHHSDAAIGKAVKLLQGRVRQPDHRLLAERCVAG
jgi:hypothetical protein